MVPNKEDGEFLVRPGVVFNEWMMADAIQLDPVGMW